MRAENKALEIDIDKPRVILDRDVPEKPERADTDIIDPDIDATELRKRFPGKPFDILGLAYVNLNGERVAARISATTSPSMSPRRAATTTRAPAPASLIAAPRPIPLDAPTITMIVPSNVVGGMGVVL